MMIEPEHDAGHKNRHCPAMAPLNRRYERTSKSRFFHISGSRSDARDGTLSPPYSDA